MIFSNVSPRVDRILVLLNAYCQPLTHSEIYLYVDEFANKVSTYYHHSVGHSHIPICLDISMKVVYKVQDVECYDAHSDIVPVPLSQLS